MLTGKHIDKSFVTAVLTNTLSTDYKYVLFDLFSILHIVPHFCKLYGAFSLKDYKNSFHQNIEVFK